MPVRDEGTHYNIVSITLGAISGAVILMRLAFKLLIAKTGFGLDDWFILATILVGVPSSVITSEGLVPNGLGRDIWTLKPQQITNVSEVLASFRLLGRSSAQSSCHPMVFPGSYMRAFRPTPFYTEVVFCDCMTDLVINR